MRGVTSGLFVQRSAVASYAGAVAAAPPTAVSPSAGSATPVIEGRGTPKVPLLKGSPTPKMWRRGAKAWA